MNPDLKFVLAVHQVELDICYYYYPLKLCLILKNKLVGKQGQKCAIN